MECAVVWGPCALQVSCVCMLIMGFKLPQVFSFSPQLLRIIMDMILTYNHSDGRHT